MMTADNIAVQVFDEVWERNARTFTVVYAPGTPNKPPTYRVIRPSEVYSLKYLLQEPWRIIGTYKANGGFNFLVEDLEFFMQSHLQTNT